MPDPLHILVVDDEPKMRLGMCRVLRDFQVELPELNRTLRFETTAVESGEEALAHIEANRVDVVLLDHMLPGIQGLDVLRQITEDKRDAVVVMVTAYASIATAVSAGKQGAYDFLAKPFTPQELKETMRKATHYLVVERQARQLERERQQMRFQLMSVVVHELKAPLNAIDSYLQILNDPNIKLDEGRVKHVTTRCQVRLDGMRKMITDLLDLTRIESGHKQRHLVPVDLVKIAQAPIEGAIQTATELKLTVNAHLPPTLPMVGDENELEIILNNLLSNAVKYNKLNGRVDLTVTDEGETVRIAVTDTGIGMTREEANRLFGEFVRIKNAKTRNIPGSGLGLSILKKLALLYGGTVSVDTQPDIGSTFAVTLRKAPEEED